MPTPSTSRPTEAAATLDARGRRCVLLSLAVAEAIEPLPASAVLEVLSDDPAAPSEIPAWCRRTGHELLTLEPEPESGYRLLLRRRP